MDFARSSFLSQQSRTPSWWIGLFSMYMVFYGTISIYISNMFIRSIKDVMLIVIVVICLGLLIKNKIVASQHLILILYLLIAILTLGSIQILSSLQPIEWMYGFKITFLPMCALLVGLYFSKRNIWGFIDQLFLLIFIIVILTWLIQYFIGMDALASLGFQYGVNIKHFTNGFPRLPSIVGTPNAYALLLALVGIYLEYSKMFQHTKNWRWSIKILTLVFILLSTNRNAIVFWFICQLIMLLWNARQYSYRRKLRMLSALFIISPIVTIIAFPILSNAGLFSTHSLQARLVQWGMYLNPVTMADGVVGMGLGGVGAASRRLADMSFTTLDYSVDNQYLAYYLQVGVVGTLFILTFFGAILYNLWEGSHQHHYSKLVLTLFAGVLIPCFFANVLEVFPFNVFLWFLVGLAWSHSVTNQRDHISSVRETLT